MTIIIFWANTQTYKIVKGVLVNLITQMAKKLNDPRHDPTSFVLECQFVFFSNHIILRYKKTDSVLGV